MSDTTRHVLDSTAVAGVIGTLFDLLPRATALLTFVWVLIRLYETRTVQESLERMRAWLYD